MNNTNVKSLLESLLFVASRPLSIKELCKFIEESSDVVEEALLGLQAEREQSGTVFLHSGDKWQMATHADNTPVVRKFLQSDLKETLSEASLEVLAIIAYRGPIGRAEIEAIRGVNCQYTLRTLLMRGLIERAGEARGSHYRVTTDLLQHLGLQKINDLPDYETNPKKLNISEVLEINEENPVKISVDSDSPAL